MLKNVRNVKVKLFIHKFIHLFLNPFINHSFTNLPFIHSVNKLFSHSSIY